MSILHSLIAATFPITGRLLRSLDPETAHALTIRALALGLMPGPGTADDAALAQTLWNRRFPNPLGLAAGFDKNGVVVDALSRLGFSHVEVGTVTPLPQSGNPKPRLFRLPEREAVVNRMGFNNDGVRALVERLRIRAARNAPGIVAINLGKNKLSPRAADDYVAGVREAAPWADMLVINVSSPNTPGLRALQGRGPLKEILFRSLRARSIVRPDDPPPLLLKIAPDLTPEDKEDIAAAVLETGVDGLVVSNTTVERPVELSEAARGEGGGLSGRPLFAPSTALLGEMWRLTGGRVPMIGVGGVSTGDEAYAKIRAGASLVQLYTALIYRGPAIIPSIKNGILRRLKADGFASVAEAVGADHRRPISDRGGS